MSIFEKLSLINNALEMMMTTVIIDLNFNSRKNKSIDTRNVMKPFLKVKLVDLRIFVQCCQMKEFSAVFIRNRVGFLNSI